MLSTGDILENSRIRKEGGTLVVIPKISKLQTGENSVREIQYWQKEENRQRHGSSQENTSERTLSHC